MEDSKLSKGQLTSQRILEATAKCIAKIGIEKTSITAIAKEAGLKRPLIAYHFPKKDKIFFHLAIMLIQNLQFQIEELSSLGPKKYYFKCLETYIQFFNQNLVYFNCFQHFLYMASIKEEYKVLNTEFKSKFTKRLLSCLKELLKEEGINIPSGQLLTYLDQVYERLIGAIIHYNTVGHSVSAETFLNKQIKIFQHEFQLFLNNHATK